jgi:predicted flavoprotein YhiN
LLQEVAKASGISLSVLSAEALAAQVNNVELVLTGMSPLAKAISTAGGIALEQLDDTYMLRQIPGVFAAGEMLDWEAPTGGYLLQASFATGAAAGRGVLEWLAQQSS